MRKLATTSNPPRAQVSDVTFAWLKGKADESERSAGTCEQQQPGTVLIN
jgi:hypothetical protein